MEGFKGLAEEIKGTLGRLEQLARERSSLELAERVDALRKKLDSDHFHIVVMGQFKRGKTTFINSLLGVDILPSSVIPLTSVNTLLRYGDEPTARVHYLDDRKERIALKRISEFVTERENPENRLRVKAVEVFYPSPYLKDGVCFVDTPGVGSTFLHNDQMAYSYLSHADAVIFMLSADPPISQAELDFLHDIRSFVGKVFFVQNKVDYLDEEEKKESLEFNARVISEALGGKKVEIYPLSAKAALRASLGNDPALLAESGLPSFVKRLDDFLLREKGLLLLQSVLRNLLKLVSDEISGLELERSLLARTREDLQRRIAAFREEMVRLRRERDELMYLIDGDFQSMVKEVLDPHVDEFKKRALPKVMQRYLAFCRESAGVDGSSFQKELKNFVQSLILESFTEWRLEEEELLSTRFGELCGLYRDKANAVARRILQKAGDVFEIELSSMEADLSLEDEGEFWFKLEDRPTDIEMFFGAITRALPRKLSQRVIAKQNRERLLELFDRHCGRVRYDFFLRLQKSFNSLRVQVYDLVEETIRAVESSVERAVARRDFDEAVLQSALSELEKYLGSLKEVKCELLSLSERVSGAEA